MVYFIQCGIGGPVKIGSAIEPWRRIKQLQTASHEELVLLKSIPGGRPRETEIKKLLNAHRIRGEWFQPVGEVLDFIKGLDEAEFEVINYRAYAVLRRNTEHERTDACPFCGCRHLHGIEDGHRIAHCSIQGTQSEVRSGQISLEQADGYIIRTRWRGNDSV